MVNVIDGQEDVNVSNQMERDIMEVINVNDVWMVGWVNPVTEKISKLLN